MNWLFLVAGLLIGWIGELIFDYLFWRRRPVADEIGRIEAELNGEIDALRQTLTTVEADLTGKREEFDALNRRFLTLEGEFTAKSEAFDLLQTNFNGLESERNSLQIQLAELKAALEAKTTDYDAQLTMYSELEGEMNTKTKELDILWDKHSALEKEFNDQKLDLNNRIQLGNELELALQNKTGECESCNEEVDKLNLELTNLRAELFDVRQQLEDSQARSEVPTMNAGAAAAAGLAAGVVAGAGQIAPDQPADAEKAAEKAEIDPYDIEIELPEIETADTSLIDDDRRGLEIDLSDLAVDGQDDRPDKEIDRSAEPSPLPATTVNLTIIEEDEEEPTPSRSRFDWTFGLSKWFEGEEREITGSGAPGETVEVYHDEDFVGTASIDTQGRWAFPFAIPAGFSLSKLAFFSRDRDGQEIEVSGDEQPIAEKPDTEESSTEAPERQNENPLPAYEVDIAIPGVVESEQPPPPPVVDPDRQTAEIEIDLPQLSGSSSPDYPTVDLETGISTLDVELPTLDADAAASLPETVDLEAAQGEIEVESPEVTLDFDWPTVDMSNPAAGVEIDTPQLDSIEVEPSLLNDIDDGSGTTEIDIDLPSVTFAPEDLAPTEGEKQRGWFNWDRDFSGWQAGEEKLLSGKGEPGERVDVVYDGKIVGQAEVDADGNWSFPWSVPTGFSLGALSFLGRNRAGEKIEEAEAADRKAAQSDANEPETIELDIELPETESSPDASVELKEAPLNKSDSDSDIEGEIEVEIPEISLPSMTAAISADDIADRDSDKEASGSDEESGDDLTRIWGIGPQIGRLLHKRGTTTFAALSQIRPDEVEAVLKASKVPKSRIPSDPYTVWTEQAGLAATGDWGAVEAYVDANRRDDLKLIWGIGPKVEGLLHAKGVYTFEKLSKMTPEAVNTIISEAGTRFVLSPDKLHSSWIQQAAIANTEDWDEFDRIKQNLSWKKVN